MCSAATSTFTACQPMYQVCESTPKPNGATKAHNDGSASLAKAKNAMLAATTPGEGEEAVQESWASL